MKIQKLLKKISSLHFHDYENIFCENKSTYHNGDYLIKIDKCKKCNLFRYNQYWVYSSKLPSKKVKTVYTYKNPLKTSDRSEE